jgi:outer membrane protein TolC
LESDRITIRRELVEPVPDIVVEAGVGRNFEADQTTAAARVGIELPIFDRNQGTIRQAEADFARQQGEIRRLELILKQELTRTYRDYLTALQHATNYGEVILPEARSAYELQLRSYKDDRITWPEVLRTQENYFMFRAEYIRNLMAWRENEILISGFLLHGGLMAPSAPPPPGHINAVPKPR